MQAPTKSELLFAAYCQRRGFLPTPIEPQSGLGRSPDFFVATPLGKIIVEVKELAPNDQDSRMAEEISQDGRTSGSHFSGFRPRRKIVDAVEQLLQHAHRKLPGVVVLHDNIVVNGYREMPPDLYLNSREIDIAMFSWISIMWDEKWWNRKLDKTYGSIVSAVAVLQHTDYLTEPFMVTYHNHFADVPLPFGVFSGPYDTNFVKEGDAEELLGKWRRVSAGDVMSAVR